MNSRRNNLIVRLIVIIAILTGLVAMRPVQVALAATVTNTFANYGLAVGRNSG